MNKFLLAALAFAGSSMIAFAAENETDNMSDKQTTDLLNIDVRARVDWQNVWYDGTTDDSNSGFEGKYLMLRLDGRIVDGLTYSWRQRFNKSTFDSSFFDATDWLNVTYETNGFDFSAGKQVVAIGGWEYDRNPVDLYSTGVFWQNVNCYQLGVSAGYQFTAKDHLLFQVSQSMFHTAQNRNMYDYNLLWRAQHGLWQPIWSVNLSEYAPGRYINYIMLGNRFDYGKAYLEFDLMNRYAHHQAFLLRDCSLIAEIGYAITPAWRLHAKYTYDVNKANNNADLYVLPGTELSMAGGGIEFYPLKKKRTALRLHANCYGSWGKNANAADVMQSKTVVLDFGVTWDMNLLNLK
ncbi:MAG: OprO/OprP family phosphate-selective porin [Muribaculaceae bacterium]|nr:OprO/OprP family phosphate-selective porin [Muribaculaceae bacterium]